MFVCANICLYVCMYVCREQAEANALKRQSMRPDERISFHDRASLQLFRGTIVCMYVCMYI